MNTDLIEKASSLIGVYEWKEGINPKIKQMFEAIGMNNVLDDTTAWCAAFTGFVLKECGYKNTQSASARSYQNFGEAVDPKNMQAGDIIVWKRGNSTWQGHVEFVVKRRGTFVDVIGGNVKNQVTRYTRKINDDLIAVRRVTEDDKLVKTTNAKPKTQIDVVTKNQKSNAPTIIGAIAALISAAIVTFLGFVK